MSRTSLLKGGVSALALSASAVFSAQAASFDITSGTVTTPQTLADGETGNVASGAELSVTANGGSGNAVTVNGNTVVITNAGLIQNLGTGRAIQAPSGGGTTRNITLNNSGTISSADDAFRINVNVSGGTIIVDNSGTIHSNTGQGLDFNAIHAGTATIEIYNRAGGLIESDGHDAIRPGQNGLVDNAGTISNVNADPLERSAIRGDEATNFTVINRASGVIEGAHHGVDQNINGVAGNPASSFVTVTNYGTIRGNNGSGVGSDGFGTVTNYGRITGAYLGSGNGDGDGVDIDYIGTVTNYGIIEGTGAGGVDSGGFANHSEGIAMGGGTIINAAGALISGADRGILIDNGSAGSAWGAVTIENAGTIQGLAGDAISVVGNYDDTLLNSGLIIGNIDLGGGTNILDNLEGGVLEVGSTLHVGVGNTLNNAGTISPGGTGTITTTLLTGSLVQSATGALAIDINAIANTSDQINVTETADLQGNVRLSVAGLAISGGTVTVLSATGGTSHNDLGLIASPALQASLVYPNANDVQVSYNLSFAPTGIGLTRNETSLGSHLNDAVIADPTKLTGITDALLNVTTAGGYIAALDQLSPEIYGDGAVSNLYGAHSFGNALLSCHKREAQYAAVSEDECLWAAIAGRTFNQDASDKGLGYDEETWGVSAGGQVNVAPNLVLGIAGGIESGTADATSGASADTNRAYAGVALKHTTGPWVVAAAVFGGTGSSDVTRPINFGGLTTTATGDQTISHLSGRLRVAYQAGGNVLYAKPLVDLEATQLWLGSVQEQGGVGALNIAGSEETIFSAAPAIEIGGETKLAGGTLVRPFARLGAVFYSEDSIALSSAFVGGPAGIANFDTLAQVEQAMGNVGAGLDLMWTDGTAIKAQYDGLFGEDTQQHSFSAKASVNF
ncbi:MAG: autotransporter domain-containing protein [Hyphomicrobium sp.]